MKRYSKSQPGWEPKQQAIEEHNAAILAEAEREEAEITQRQMEAIANMSVTCPNCGTRYDVSEYMHTCTRSSTVVEMVAGIFPKWAAKHGVKPDGTHTWIPEEMLDNKLYGNRGR